MIGLFKPKLSPLWSFRKEGAMWLSQFLDNGNLIVERRVGERRAVLSERRVSFFSLDAQTGKPIWDDFMLKDERGNLVGEGWWVGLELTHKHLFYLHGYVAPRIPEHRGLWALDAQTTRLVWKNDAISFVARAGDEFLVYRPIDNDDFAERRYFVLNALTGETLRELSAKEADAFRNAAIDVATAQGVTLPTRHDAFSPDFNRFKSLAEKATSAKNVVAGYDVIEFGDRLILGYHEQTDKIVLTQSGSPVKALVYKLFVLENGKPIYADLLGEAMSGLLTDGFFLRANRLYFTKNQNALVALEL
ncbi:MAG: DUF4905 domain-containing protein [Chloroherpetonaceae bacterium]|nr:DUF4905 domain-containing protein [Chloroherpetonaceae bacterium]MDW8437424.1 DUF4905 domain-containing protein [Chloroherpetonaceae bacterium]